jgi:ATP-binding cassette subfamily B protein
MTLPLSRSASEYDLRNAVTSNRLAGLGRLMTGYRLAYLAATLSLAVAAVLKVATFLLLRYFVDSVLGRQDMLSLVPRVAWGFVGLAVLEGLFTFLSGRLAARTAEGITLRLRNYLFDHIQRLSFTYHDHTPTGELIERCTSDVDAVRRFFADQAIGVGRIVAVFGVSLAALLRMNAQLALLSVAVVPVLVAISLFFFRKVSKVYEALQEQEAVVSTTLQENLTGVRVVRAFARQDFERQKFERQNWEKFQRGKRFMQMHSLYWPVSDLLCGAQMLIGVSVGALVTMRGAISIGTYLAYVGLLIWVIWPIRNLGRFIVQMSSGLVSYQRVAEVIAAPREPLDEGDYQTSGDVRGEIVFDSVGFVYPSGQQALDSVSFRCQPGQAVALLGSTGSGKTTLVHLLPRFYEYSSGSLTLDGVELRRYPRHYLRRQIGLVEQESFLFSRSVRENLTYGVRRSVSDAEIEAAARTAAIHQDIAEFAQGYDTLVGERGVMLSGGQKQRVAIARTLLKDPRILILDDSTSSVDTETEHLIREALQCLMRGRTTFIIAHRIQSVMNADLILVFDKGRIVQRGVHRELMQQDGIYQRVFELQTRLDAELEREASGVRVL